LTHIEERTAARLVLLDEAKRILLFLHNDGHGRTFWATPGGGLEPGETLQQAAVREAAEELGVETADLVQLWSGHARFKFANRAVSQTETFFLVTQQVDLTRLELGELHRVEGIIDVRWWSLDEIQKSDALIFPADLVDKLREHLPALGKRP